MFKHVVFFAALLLACAAKPLVLEYPGVAAYSAPYAAAYTAPLAYSTYSAYSPYYSAYTYASPYTYYLR